MEEPGEEGSSSSSEEGYSSSSEDEAAHGKEKRDAAMKPSGRGSVNVNALVRAVQTQLDEEHWGETNAADTGKIVCPELSTPLASDPGGLLAFVEKHIERLAFLANESFSCDHDGCSTSCRTPSKLRKHKAYVHGPANHACSHCTKAFPRAVHLL
ncbi:hypothetical protein DFS34DRAFT_594010 [Phlyctochytrium arcticum]|nr:hypothetical protein DFS34DRAFT_594010 [Phlyctochytrium arcticum]